VTARRAELLDAAETYARRGWRVVPLYAPEECAAGRCGAAGDCQNPGKHPRLREWTKSATADAATVRQWWRRWPDSNVGVATGAGSGLVVLVLDIDPRHGGDEALAQLEAEHGPLPATIRSLTGGGGEHVLFVHPGGHVGNQQGAATVGPGLDVRGDGGQFVAPPSRHASGRPYAWEVAHHPSETDLAPAPGWLLARIRQAEAGGARPGAAPPVGEIIQDGARNATLASLAGSMRRRGMSPAEIADALLSVNARRCRPPLAEAEVRAIAASVGRYAPASDAGASSTPWARAEAAPVFVTSEDDPAADFIEARLLARGSVTEWFSPRGLGKTHAGHGLLVKHARLGRRVLLIDRDNSRREVRRRLRAWGAADAPTLHILTRDGAPALTDRAAWRTFPVASYDLVLVDSLDASTEGVGEQDSARPSLALASLLDVVRQENGPAILVLGNTIKTGSHGRGSGVTEDRADIVYEVRDATGLQPSGGKPWWLELPAAGRDAWGERAVRRRRRDRYRLAFIPSKFRVGEEPDPFILEIDLSGEPWDLRDVTADLEAAGRAAVETRAADQAERRTTAELALTVRIGEQADAGAPWTTSQAERYLADAHGLRRREARELVAAGRAWRLKADRSRRGHPRLLFLAVPSAGGS
jgi:putative DNA primase/helicase